MSKPLSNLGKGFFIIGTDTSIGKTTVSVAILIKLAAQGLKTLALKPVATGARNTVDGLRNDDALLLQKYATCKLSYDQVNPFVYSQAISPNLAAIFNNSSLTASEVLAKTLITITNHRVDFLIIEGAGGLYTPINRYETMADLITGYNYPVIVVVGIKLGVINHAMLTFEALAKLQAKVSGWIANIIDPRMKYASGNIRSIQERVDILLLGVIPYQNKIDGKKIAKYLDLPIS